MACFSHFVETVQRNFKVKIWLTVHCTQLTHSYTHMYTHPQNKITMYVLVCIDFLAFSCTGRLRKCDCFRVVFCIYSMLICFTNREQWYEIPGVILNLIFDGIRALFFGWYTKVQCCGIHSPQKIFVRWDNKV